MLALGFILFGSACLLMILAPTLLRGWVESRLTDKLLHTTQITTLRLNLFSGHLEIEGLRVRAQEADSDLIVIRQVIADIELLPLFNQDVVFRRLDIHSPEVNLVRAEDSLWNVALHERRSSGKSMSQFMLHIQNATLSNGRLTIEHRSIIPARTTQMTRIHLAMTDLSSNSIEPAKIHGSAELSHSGTLMIKGVVGSDFRSGMMTIHLSDVSLDTIQNCFGNPLSVRGQVDARLSVTWPGKGTSLIGISGAIEGHKLVWASADRSDWRVAEISIAQLDAVWPDTVTLNRVVVTKPDIWVRRNKNGRFVGVGRGPAHSSTQSPASSSTGTKYERSPPTRWVINTIIIRDGAIHLEDRSVTPMYSDGLQNLELSLDKLMSTPSQPVRITARADIASGGALEIYGRASLLDPLPSASLKAVIHQLAVPSTNPYLERTLSHHTTDGRLTSVMDIHLRGNELEVTSHVTLSDLQVEPVRNSTSRTVQERIGLPLGLLIALLKDDMGRITISFPVSGLLSNPTFDWTNAIWATIRQAVIKLVALPIRSIGQLVMGNQESASLRLEPITFDPGSATIRQSMERRLHDLAKLLGSTNGTVLHMTPILSATDLDALQHLPQESWPISGLDTAETAGHVLAVRRAYLVATHVAGLNRISSDRLPVNPPRHDLVEAVMPRVELRLENTETIPLPRVQLGKQDYQ